MQDDSDAMTSLSALLEADEVEALRRRIHALDEEPVMPQPYSRRDVPWPWL